MKDFLNSDEFNPVYLINVVLISIILYLHHSSYTNNYFSLLNSYKINVLLQKFSVGGFFFFSGLKLIISNLESPALFFFKRRIIRIYILYLIALIIAAFTSYPYLHNGDVPTLSNFFLHAFCSQTILPSFSGENFHTLWFVSMLFICYLLFVIMRKDILNIKKFMLKQIIISTIISAIYIVTLEHELKIFFRDFAVYMLFFSFGMIATNLNPNAINKKLYFLIGLIGNLVLLIIYNTVYINTWYEYAIYVPFVILSNVSLFCILPFALKTINFSNRAKWFLIKYSSASFCVFLFHRSVWSIMAMFYPKGTFLQWSYIIILGIPIIIICSYWIQYYFDLTLCYLTTKSNRVDA